MNRPPAASALVCMALAALAPAGCERPAVEAFPAPAPGPEPAPRPDGLRLPAFEELYRQTSPAVVNVLARQAMPFLEADRPGYPAVHGMGSGFLLDGQGHLVTSASVVQDAEEILVVLPTGRELRARLVALDAGTDLAVLRADLPPGAPPLPAPPPLERAGSPRSGDWVVAIGYPYGLGHTLTAGVVSAVLSPAETQAGHGLVLTDAAVNPGCNGGPLIDERGRVVGVLHLPGQEEDGLGRAIPMRDAWPILEELRAGRVPRRAWLGVRTQFVSHELARTFGLPAAQGALVSQVEPGSPAARAGLRKGDVLVRLGPWPVEDPEALVEALRRSRPGTPVKAELLREGKPLSLTVTPRPEP